MRFGRDYYRRYYFDPRTAVATRAEMHARARLIAALATHAGLPVRRILEAGCGTGMLRAPLLRLLPRARYVGLETSDYLCARYGWERGRIESYRAAPFDLLICYDVLQYLEPRRRRGCAAQLRAPVPRRAVLQRPHALRLRAQLRPCAHRRRRAPAQRALVPHAPAGATSREAGLGFWLRRGAPLTLWELETG